jgi:hypothetical protein
VGPSDFLEVELIRIFFKERSCDGSAAVGGDESEMPCISPMAGHRSLDGLRQGVTILRLASRVLCLLLAITSIGDCVFRR